MERESFMDFYSDFSDEDPEYIHEYLVAHGIDIDRLQANLLELVEKRKAELKREEGKKFKSAYEELRRRASKLGETIVNKSEAYSAGVSYRKLEGEGEENEKESAEEAEKLRMIKQAKKSLSDGDKDE